MSATDERLRRRARELWEAGGRPTGREAEFLERARELIAMEDNADAGRLPNPAARPSRAEGGVEEAEIQQNYGEVPGRFTDHGDRPQTPRPHAPRRRE